MPLQNDRTIDVENDQLTDKCGEAHFHFSIQAFKLKASVSINCMKNNSMKHSVRIKIRNFLFANQFISCKQR